jgi:hypothetical protein
MGYRVSYVALSLALLLLAASTHPPVTVAQKAQSHPDIDGDWDFSTLTPLERPKGIAGSTFASDAEKAEFLKRDSSERQATFVDRDDLPPYGIEWYEWGTDTNRNRTSLIVDPADGRLPPTTPEASQRAAARFAKMRQQSDAGPEDRSLQERCIVGPNAGPPMIPSFYNNHVQIVATDSYAMLITEMIHTPRVIPLQQQSSPVNDLRYWSGQSRGRWDGDALVIDTGSFRSDAAEFVMRGASEQLRLQERFSRVDANTLLYEFTVTDPQTWTRPWTASVYMTKSKEPMYEYACHEGNYGLTGILAGARVSEKQALENPKGSAAPK